MELVGKVCLITGGARIGGTVAEELATRGCHVAVTYRASQASAGETVALVRAMGRSAAALQADVSKEAEVRDVVAAVERQFGRLDILVNMASVYRPMPLDALDENAWQENMSVDLGSTFRMSQAAVPLMRRQGAGRIVNFADWTPASRRPRYRDYLPYYVAKAGVIALTEALALELAPHILVNAIAPGPILPPANMTPEEQARVCKATPLGGWGGPKEIARAVIFLVETEFVTGECIRVDGGRHLN